MKYRILLIIITLLFCLPGNSFTQDLATLPEFTGDDRVLILSPHPDDETIGAGGLIQKARDAGAQVKVVWLTNGDSNELAFLAYKKIPVLSRGSLLKMGELRREESLRAMKRLNVAPQDLTFLGYPDLGTLNMFLKYWGDGMPLKSMLTRVTQVPYADSPSYQKLYTGENILADVTSILASYQPTMILTTMPSDTNPDHRAAWLFLQIALWDLKDKMPMPQVFPFVVHVPQWPSPRGYHPELPLGIPANYRGADLQWFTFPLENEMIEIKKNALREYKSQLKYKPNYLDSFVRQNELFGQQPILQLRETESTDWERVSHTLQSFRSRVINEAKSENKNIDSVLFAQKNGRLYVWIKFNTMMSELLGTHLFLFGYREDIPFAIMPKIRIVVRGRNKLMVYDKKRTIEVPDVMSVFLEDRVLEISVPLKVLQSPQYLLASVSTLAGEVIQDVTSWRTFQVETNSPQ